MPGVGLEPQGASEGVGLGSFLPESAVWGRGLLRGFGALGPWGFLGYFNGALGGFGALGYLGDLVPWGALGPWAT